MTRTSNVLKTAHMRLMGANIGLKIPYDFLRDLVISLIEGLNVFVEERGPNYQLHENEVISAARSTYTNVAGETRDIRVRVAVTSSGRSDEFGRPSEGVTGIINDIVEVIIFVEASPYQLLGDGVWLMQAMKKKMHVIQHEFVHAIDPALSRMKDPASKARGQTEGNAYLQGIFEDIREYTEYRGKEFFERLQMIQRATGIQGALHKFLQSISRNYVDFYFLYGRNDQRALRRVLQKVYTFLEGEISPIE